MKCTTLKLWSGVNETKVEVFACLTFYFQIILKTQQIVLLQNLIISNETTV